MKAAVTLFIIFLSAGVFKVGAKPRFVDFDLELSTASYIETVVIMGYEEGNIQFRPKGSDSLLSAPAGIYVARKLLKSTANYPTYYTAHWPKEGDELLIVLDSNGRVSLFAESQDTTYRFWSPYETWSIAMFWFSAPALPLPLSRDNDPYLRAGECWDGCLLPKDKLQLYRQKKQ